MSAQDVLDQLNGNIVTNGQGAITAALLNGDLTAIVNLIAGFNGGLLGVPKANFLAQISAQCAGGVAQFMTSLPASVDDPIAIAFMSASAVAPGDPLANAFIAYATTAAPAGLGLNAATAAALLSSIFDAAAP